MAFAGMRFDSHSRAPVFLFLDFTDTDLTYTISIIMTTPIINIGYRVFVMPRQAIARPI
jgi:hypothetical protein